jgi:hypothetical protein
VKLKLIILVVLVGFTPSFSAIAYDPLDCLNDASKVDKDIIVGLATKLCSGAWTAEPVKCYAQISRVYTAIYPVELLSIFVPVPPMQKTPSSVMGKRVKEVLRVF